MPGQVAMTTMSPAKMRGKNLRFLPTSFLFLAAASHSLRRRLSYHAAATSTAASRRYI